MKQVTFHHFLEQHDIQVLQTNEPIPEFSYLGIYNPSLILRATRYLKIHTSGDIETALRAFLDTVYRYHVSPEQSSCILIIRIWSKSTSEFDIPRWHSDGRYWNMEKGDIVKKFGTTLVGPQTLFLENSGHVQQILLHGQSKLLVDDSDSQEKLRLWLAEQYKDAPTIEQEFGKLACWDVGADDSTIHSEPPIKEARIFISLLPGTEEQIRTTCKWWSRPFESSE